MRLTLVLLGLLSCLTLTPEAHSTQATVDVSPAPILFATWAHPGEFNAIFSVAQELSNTAPPYPIWFATTEERRAEVERAGMWFVSLGNESSSIDLNDQARLKDMYNGGPGTISALIDVLALIFEPRFYLNLHGGLVKAVEERRPRLMVVDSAMWIAYDVANNNNLPVAIIMPIFPDIWYSATNPTILVASGTGSSPRHFHFFDLLQAFKRKYVAPLFVIKSVLFDGLGKDKLALTGEFDIGSKILGRARAIISTCVWGIEYPFMHGPNLHLVGAIISPRGNDKDKTSDTIIEWINSADQRVILISLGSAARIPPVQLANLASALVETVTEQKVRVLWKLPRDQHDELLALIPSELIASSTVRVVSWIPDILLALAHPLVTVNINHGGANSFNEAVYYGTPQLILPYWSDCYDVAERAVDAGVGLAVRDGRHFEREEVKQFIRRLLLEKSFGLRAAFWGDKMRRAGGARRGAQILREVLEDLELEDVYGVEDAEVTTVKVIEDPEYVAGLWAVWKVVTLMVRSVAYGLRKVIQRLVDSRKIKTN
ncbi:hypothetical protein BC938DRAFT_482206 [Jimgerdemannia flammicorona]|uniref:UDP-glycosyltransferases domain-containing protein n=1 Tax=Jimgerdemannia flammicorona TaxID=994334 RepID=A0A433QEG4_9FUNG|nr:hypothetical protein BC938DRAFT_482206 [Jimgerdemannia flammicorona]